MGERVEHNLIEHILTLLRLPESKRKTDGNLQTYGMFCEVRDFLDEIPGGFLIYRADGDEKIIYANKALVRIFGCDSEEEFRKLTGDSFKGLVYPEDLEGVEESIRKQIAGSRDGLDYVEYRIMRKDGVIRWIEDFGHFIQSKSLGNIFYVFLSDATEKISRRIVEQAELVHQKDEKEQKLRMLTEEYDKERQLIYQEHLRRLEVIEGLSVDYDSILYVDLDTDALLPYRLSVRTKKQFDAELFRRGFVPFVADYVATWVHPEDRVRVSLALSPQYIRDMLAKSKSFYVNYRCMRDGETDYLQLRFVNVTGEDGISQVVIGCRNVEEEIRQEIMQKQTLEEALCNAKTADIAKNTFLSNVSHDMRTPLNAIFGFTELARKHLRNPEDVSQYLHKIEEAGRRILDQIDKVLEISYVESQSMYLNETECDLKEILRDVYDTLIPQAARKHIEFVVDTPVTHADVCADSEKLRQVLVHLAGNAVKYTACGGKVKLTLTELEKPSHGFWVYRFTVQDTGIGITEQALERIFEPFEREKNTTLSGEFGAGLGLTIAKNIVEKMGGRIEVDSTPGVGSTFAITVGFRPQNVAAGEIPRAVSAIEFLRGKKILLVEDNALNLEIETEILEDLGFNVDTAADGKIAVEKVRAALPDTYGLILMDLQMPVMNGWEATKAIRKFPDIKAKTPIIALSANAFESDKRASAEAGIDAHLTKPMDTELLLETIEKVLSSSDGGK